jgi:hypothetical protein
LSPPNRASEPHRRGCDESGASGSRYPLEQGRDSACAGQREGTELFRSPLEHAVYRRDDEDNYLLVRVYMDDLIITCTYIDEIMLFKPKMHCLLKMSDLGLISYHLGIVDQAGARRDPILHLKFNAI